MRTGSTVLSIAAPLMRTLAETRRINVGLACPDRDEMVYLESIRYNRRIVLRHVVSGHRVPMELTSLGRAYLAAAPSARRKALLDSFRLKRGAQWPALEQQIQAAIKSVKSQGFCAASWQPEVVALATPLVTPDAIYVLNCSVSTTEPLPAIVQELHPALLQLGRQIESLLEKL